MNHVYPDEATKITKIIKNRTYQGYLMDLAISQNPHTKDPKKLWKIIEKETAKGEDNTELDKSSMKMLKGKLTRSRVINVK